MSFLFFLCVSQLLSLLSARSTSLSCPPAPPHTLNATFPQTLNLTAISATNGASTLECWQLTNHFAVSTTPGQAGSAALSLGNANSASYTVLPPGFNGGMHRAPAVQYVLFFAGLAHITLPNSTAEAWVHGGRNGLIIAADTAAVSTLGHITTYPSEEQTLGLVVPTAGGEVPPHVVLHEGPCCTSEMLI
ncbi:hypothetical protein MMC30_009007 [Trapelia coarctata]|nr:hypothetical protein [Trapelia coarctata]